MALLPRSSTVDLGRKRGLKTITKTNMPTKTVIAETVIDNMRDAADIEVEVYCNLSILENVCGRFRKNILMMQFARNLSLTSFTIYTQCNL